MQLILFAGICFLFIYVYVSWLKKIGEEHDILNRTLLELDVCGWNLLHVIFYFMLCYILRVKSLLGYVVVFLVGIFWYFVEQVIFLHYRVPIGDNRHPNPNYVYHSISYPRVDDFVYNVIGILLYICTVYQKTIR